MTPNENKTAGFAYRILRIGFRTMPQPVRSAIASASWSLISSSRRGLKNLRLNTGRLVGRSRCTVCGERIWGFAPLDPAMLETARMYGCKYGPEQSETCNARNYECPVCGATDRDRLYALYLRDYFQKLPDSGTREIVDFAPSAPLSRFIKRLIVESNKTVSYRTADLFMEGVDDRIDISAMNYRDASVDFFICSHILEHVPDDRRALAELLRILRPGGLGILVVPILLTATEIDEDPTVTDVAERWRRFGQSDHVRLYSKQGFLSRVEDAGFRVHQLGAQHFGPETFKQHGITEQSVLYIVEKNG